MDAQELCNLQEAYNQVHQLDEISQKTATRAYAASSTGEFEGQDSPRDVERTDNLRKHIKRKFGDKAAKHADRAAHSMTFGRKGAGGMPSVKEDIYDIILSHLLDEGYAETNEAALAIMANMSEEWRGEIVEETKRTEYLQKKFNKENQRKSGSALTYIPGKQNTGQALQKARQSERHMRGEK